MKKFLNFQILICSFILSMFLFSCNPVTTSGSMKEVDASKETIGDIIRNLTEDTMIIIEEPIGDDTITEISSALKDLAKTEGKKEIKVGLNMKKASGIFNSGSFCRCTNLVDIRLPDCVDTISGNAFQNCTFLNNIELPENLKVIESNAFQYCNLSTINIPSSVQDIAPSAFNDCFNLRNINVDSNNAAFTSINGILYSKNKETLYRYPCGKKDTSFTVPSNVLYLGNRSFEGCRYLKNVTLQDGVTEIGQNAFEKCGECLETITIPTSVYTIGQNAFFNCYNLKTINYKGTQSQWNNINLLTDWNRQCGNYKINYNYK